MPTELPKSFEELITNSPLPVLVDFYADWCGPCKMVSPAISQLAKAYKGKIITVKVDTDRQPAVSSKYRIRSIPTIMLFEKGRELMRLQGAHSYQSLKAELERHIR